jgi:gluconolactonase
MPEIPTASFQVFARGLDHPEGLAFDREGFLWAGGEAGQVYRIAPDGSVEKMADLGGFCAGLAFSPDDVLHVCCVGRGLVRVARDGSHRVFAGRAGDHTIVTPNFPLFDPEGNLFVSDSGTWGEGDGCVARFDPAGRGRIVGGPFGYANGLALDAGARLLFMVESDSDSVLRFEVGADGRLGARELYADRVGRLPDGLALDLEGNLYVGCYASDEIWRIAPNDQRHLVAFDPHAILVNRPTNLAFGGSGSDELFVANFGRQTITRAPLGRRGKPLANQNSHRGTAR